MTERPPTRRAALTTSLGVLAGAALGAGSAVALTQAGEDHDTDKRAGAGGTPPPSDTRATDSTPAYGATQAGIDRPSTPQRFALFIIGDLTHPSNIEFLAGLGKRIARLTSDPPPDLLPDGPCGLTVNIGLGPRAVKAQDPSLPGAHPLPRFRGDELIAAHAKGGDLLIACCAQDPSILPIVADDLCAHVPGFQARWSQFGYRGPGKGTVARNPLGFRDGISVPHTNEELAKNVWIEDELAQGTICVIRRLQLAVSEFTSLPATKREQIFGRRLDGSPLSGGGPDAEVNINAKHPDGTYMIPLDAHVRAAHPTITGSHHMLRRSYSFDNGAGDIGLLFTCYQRDLRTFAMTQRQLDASDSLMKFTTATASGSFLILPGFTEDSPLGHFFR